MQFDCENIKNTLDQKLCMETHNVTVEHPLAVTSLQRQLFLSRRIVHTFTLILTSLQRPPLHNGNGLKYFCAKFREILMSGSREKGVFPRKQFFIQSQFFDLLRMRCI